MRRVPVPAAASGDGSLAALPLEDAASADACSIAEYVVEQAEEAGSDSDLAEPIVDEDIQNAMGSADEHASNHSPHSGHSDSEPSDGEAIHGKQESSDGEDENDLVQEYVPGGPGGDSGESTGDAPPLCPTPPTQPVTGPPVTLAPEPPAVLEEATAMEVDEPVADADHPSNATNGEQESQDGGPAAESTGDGPPPCPTGADTAELTGDSTGAGPTQPVAG